MVRHDADTSGRHRPVISTPTGRAPLNGLTRWAVGVVLTLLTMAVPALAKVVWDRLEKQEEQIGQQQQETTRLAVALARNEAQHETMLTLLRGLRDDLRDHRQEGRRR